MTAKRLSVFPRFSSPGHRLGEKCPVVQARPADTFLKGVGPATYSADSGKLYTGLHLASDASPTARSLSGRAVSESPPWCCQHLRAAVLWGLVGIFVKGVLDAGVGALEVAFWRCLVGGVLFCVHALSRRDLKLRAPADLGAFTAFALLIIAAHYVTFNVAVLHGGVGLVNLFLATIPALVALGAAMCGDRPNPATLGLVGLSVLGLALAAWGGGRGIHVSALSVSMSVVTTLSLAAYTVFSKPLLERYSPAGLNAFVMPLSAVALLPFVSFHAKSPEVWGLLLVLAVLPTYLAHLLYQTGLKVLSPPRAALLSSLGVRVALLTAALSGERFSAGGLRR